MSYYKTYNLYGEEIVVNDNFFQYNDIRSVYKTLDKETAKIVVVGRNHLNAMDKFIVKAPEVAKEIVYFAAETTVQYLYKYDITDVDTERFLQKYYYKYIDFEKYFDPILERYSEIMNAGAQLNQYRNIQKASKNSWSSTGTIKGTITAGVLNIGEDFFRSFGQSRVREEDKKIITEAKRNLYSSSCTEKKFIAALSNCVWGCFNAMIEEMTENGLIEPIYFDNAKASAIYNNTLKYEKDGIKILSNIVECIKLSPYNYKYWEFLLKTGNCPNEILEYAKFLGILDDHENFIREENSAAIEKARQMPDEVTHDIIKKVQQYLSLESDLNIDFTSEIKELLPKLNEWGYNKESTQKLIASFKESFDKYIERDIFKETLNLLEKKLKLYTPNISEKELDEKIKNVSTIYDVVELLRFAKLGDPLAQFKISELFFPAPAMPGYKPGEHGVKATDKEKNLIFDMACYIFDENEDRPETDACEDDDDNAIYASGFTLYMSAMGEYIGCDYMDMELMNKAIKLQCPAALYQTGKMLCMTDGPLEKDLKKGIQFIHQAADMLYRPACIDLSSWYKNGTNGLKQDLTMSEKYKDLCGGSAISINYALSQHSEKHYKDCMKFIAKISDIYNNMKHTGMRQYVAVVNAEQENDFNALLNYAQDGNARAQYSLAKCYIDGKGVAKDTEKAISWYLKSANNDNPQAQYELGIRYLEGKDVPQNADMALEWFEKALKLGNKQAKEKIIKIKKASEPGEYGKQNLLSLLFGGAALAISFLIFKKNIMISAFAFSIPALLIMYNDPLNELFVFLKKACETVFVGAFALLFYKMCPDFVEMNHYIIWSIVVFVFTLIIGGGLYPKDESKKTNNIVKMIGRFGMAISFFALGILVYAILRFMGTTIAVIVADALYVIILWNILTEEI